MVIILGKFNNKKIGLREEGTHKLLATYPYITEGTDAEVTKIVKDWYYVQSCGAEDQLLTAYVDILSDEMNTNNPTKLQ